MSDRPEREFSTLEGVAFLAAMIGIQLSSELFAQWGTYFYSPSEGRGRIVYVSIGMVAFIFVVGRIFDFVTDPLIGIWSDRTDPNARRWRVIPLRGRRRPFIFWGSIFMTGTGILFWYPPVAGESVANLVYGMSLMSLHWVFYTLANIPLTALAPEIARSQQGRVRLGTWIAVGMTIGLAMAVVLPGVLITALDPARQQPAANGQPSFTAAGYQRVAILFSLTALVMFQFFVWTIRERATKAQPASTATPMGEMIQGFRHKVFRLYFVILLFFYIGYWSVQRALPYWAELGLGGDESTVTWLAIPFMITCLGAALVAPILTKRIDLKWLLLLSVGIITFGLPMMYVIGKLDASTDVKMVLGACLFALAGVGQGFVYVLLTPLLGEIIDLDEARFGRRREALFNGLHGLIIKLALVSAIFVATNTLRFFGNSVENPTGVLLVGPIGGLFGLVALIAVLRYPVLNPVRRATCASPPTE
ncbi:MAG: MFS transporter [Phycisphaerae bacterium]|nr:MFS transporter [Phycisphaerae bacterium]